MVPGAENHGPAGAGPDGVQPDRHHPAGSRWSLAGAALAAGLVPLVVLAVLSVSWSEAALQQEISHRVASTADVGSSYVATRLAGVARYTESYARRPPLIDALRPGRPTDRDLLDSSMEDLLRGDSGLSSAFVLDPAGRVVSHPRKADSIGTDFSFRAYYQIPARTGATYVSTAFASVWQPHHMVVVLATPIRDPASGEVLGYLGATHSLASLQEYLTRFGRDRSTALTVVDQEGGIVATSTRAAGAPPEPAEHAWIDPALGGQSGVVHTTLGDRDLIVGYSPLPASGWAVAATIDEEEATAPIRRLRTAIAVLAAALTGVLVTGAAYLIRLIGLRDRADAELREAHHALQRANTELEHRVKERTSELEAANSELESFCYNVSHDLRAPLRAIDGFSHALEEDYGERLDAGGRHQINRVRQGARSMGRRIDDLLRLSRLTREPMRTDRVDLSTLARRICDQLAAAGPDHHPTVSIQDGITVQGDERLLAAALENLLANAWKFTARSPDPAIAVAAVTAGDEVVVSVRDNGAGFDMSYADKLFQPFQRLHSTDEFEGTGVGLAIVARVVRRHGGRVWAEAEPGQGATFWFTVPASAREEGAAPVAAPDGAILASIGEER